jgi:hypothetical protein
MLVFWSEGKFSNASKTLGKNAMLLKKSVKNRFCNYLEDFTPFS